MSAESEAFKIWWLLHPTLADVTLFVIIILLGGFGWFSMHSDRQKMETDKKEYEKKIVEINTLVVTAIGEVKGVLNDFVLQSKIERRLIEDHLVRHEKITEDMSRICRSLDDHEDRIRALQHWNGNERRGR